MIRLLVAICAVPAAIGIIVTDPPAAGIKYKYGYDIEDPTTGDKKTQFEVKQGDVVTGQYSVVDPDGTKRIVDYNVHPSRGFTAVVHTEPAVIQQPAPLKNNYVIPIRNPEELRKYVPGPDNGYLTDRLFPYAYQSKDYPDPSAVYFTPENEISYSRDPFNQGQFFLPSQKGYKL